VVTEKIWLPFNINEYVKVRLTDHGREIHRQSYDRLMEKLRLNYDYKPFRYTPPEEDDEGYSEWQLWVLMQEFGPHVYNGCKPCFETMIRVGHERGGSPTEPSIQRRVPEGTRDLDMEEV
jgi:hypothetical protein